MNKQINNRRPDAFRDRRAHMQPNSDRQPRRRAASWNEQARQALAAPVLDRPERKDWDCPRIEVLSMASALRQPEEWDLRDLRAMDYADYPLAPEVQPEVKVESARRASSHAEQHAGPHAGPHAWKWWEVVAPIAISLGALAQLLQGMRW